MRIELAEEGICLPDYQMRAYVQFAIGNKANIYTSNQLVIDIARAELLTMSPSERPEIEWFVYGSQVDFDEDLRNSSTYEDKRAHLLDDVLGQICWPQKTWGVN